MQKIKSEKVIDEIYRILLKKAKGFYYDEITTEYVCDKKPIKTCNAEDDVQLSLFDEKTAKTKEKYKNKVTILKSNDKSAVNLKCEEDVDGSFIFSKDNKMEGEKAIDESVEQITMAKKKVTTHFVPPDLAAIKMLLENFEKIDEPFDNLSTEELISLARKLQKDLKIL